MPTNMLTVDANFPQLSREQSTDEKFERITSYLHMMLEQLRYSMGNLDKDNFNAAGLDEIANLITKPVYIQLENEAKSIAALYVTAEGLSSRLSDAEGNVSTLQQSAAAMAVRLTNAEGDITQLAAAAGVLTSRISDAEGNISQLTQTSDSLTSRISDTEGNVSIIQQTVNGLTVTDASGTTRVKGSSVETGSLILTGVIKWADLTSDVQTAISDAGTNASNALSTANGAYTAANGAQTNLALLANGQYQGGTFISGTSIYSPELVGDEIKLANGSSYEVGKISMQVSNTPAFDITSNLSLRLQSAAGWNAYLGNGYAEGSGSVAAVLCNASGVLNLYGAAISVSSANFGSTLPSSGVSGQVFFLLG